MSVILSLVALSWASAVVPILAGVTITLIGRLR